MCDIHSMLFYTTILLICLVYSSKHKEFLKEMYYIKNFILSSLLMALYTA
ncbi:hypothetical protein HanPSC8_Chr07g0286461 [Helianthus annuus]|nr:hypothetical protein HanPSC8_Chr07g0286461 [Helianthus annuus]